MLPNLLIIGAAKAGTTTIYEQLKHHPEIFMSPVKEPNYFVIKRKGFSFKANTVARSYQNSFTYNLNDYTKLFKNSREKKIIGEASPIYLYDKEAPSEIKEVIPSVKLIVILRNPVERAFSNFAMHHVGGGLETTQNFIEALALEEERKKENWWWGFYYKEAGLYAQQLKRYFSTFDKHQILVLFFEDLKNNPEIFFENIYKFLGINKYSFENIYKKYKVTRIPRFKFLENLLNNSRINSFVEIIINKKYKQNLGNIIRKFNNYNPKINKQEYNYLVNYYIKDIKELEKILDVDLSHWLSFK